MTFEVAKNSFETGFKQDIEKFEGLVERIKNQYNQLKKPKERLPNNHAIVQMDFAENYNCQSSEEPQSAH